jgi:pimeloyl-ACP methyl ester carboxylesterase
MSGELKRIRTSSLDIAYEESGAADGAPVFLMHGWPYDPRCYDEVIPPLICAASALRDFSPPTRRARGSRRRSATICAS